MSRTWLAFAGAAAALAILLMGMILLHATEKRRRIVDRRLEQVRQPQRKRAPGDRAQQPAPGWLRLAAVIGLGLARSGLLPASTLRELRNSLGNTPLAGPNGVGIFVGLKVLGALLGVLAALSIARIVDLGANLRIVVPVLGGVAGILAPDFVLRRLRLAYIGGVETGLPDALDMMVICSEAGLALEPTIERVSLELAPAHPAVACEFALTAQEMRLIADRALVLTNLGTRTGVEDLRRLGATLIQTVQLGTPITQALRVLASEMRQEAMTRYEGRAARLPVLLTLPMILFVLPCVFIVVGGPAAIQIIESFSKK